MPAGSLDQATDVDTGTNGMIALSNAAKSYQRE